MPTPVCPAVSTHYPSLVALNFPRESVTVSKNPAFHPHNAEEYENKWKADNRNLSQISSLLTTLCFVSVNLSWHAPQQKTHQTAAALMSCRTTINKHPANLLRATLLLNETGLRVQKGWHVQSNSWEEQFNCASWLCNLFLYLNQELCVIRQN